MEYDVFADYHMNIFCNFRCTYCYIQSKKKKDPAHRGKDISRITRGFEKSGLTWFINLTGGEPFLQPNFVELCRELTKKHYLSIMTNLSTNNVYDFAEKVNPKRVAFVHCALHIDERERLNLVEDFVEKYYYLKKHDFNICASQTAYPPIVPRLEEIHSFLRKEGIIVKPKIFRGPYRLRLYPASYTNEERKTILKLFDLSEQPHDRTLLQSDPARDKVLVNGAFSFGGCMCRAGKDFVVILSNGNVLRCIDKRMKLGNLFRGRINLLQETRPCPGGVCVSPHYGLMFAEGTPKVIKSHSTMERVKPIANRIIDLVR